MFKLELHKIPFIYSFIHFSMGILSKYNPFTIQIFLFYQFLQLILNIRIFMLSLQIRSGNNIFHTLRKIGEFMFGYLIT